MSLVVKDLTKRYGDKVVVDHLSFAMSQPGVYALLGTNGAGKTTSIRMMLNMLSRRHQARYEEAGRCCGTESLWTSAAATWAIWRRSGGFIPSTR